MLEFYMDYFCMISNYFSVSSEKRTKLWDGGREPVTRGHLLVGALGPLPQDPAGCLPFSSRDRVFLPTFPRPPRHPWVGSSLELKSISTFAPCCLARQGARVLALK